MELLRQIDFDLKSCTLDSDKITKKISSELFSVLDLKTIQGGESEVIKQAAQQLIESSKEEIIASAFVDETKNLKKLYISLANSQNEFIIVSASGLDAYCMSRNLIDIDFSLRSLLSTQTYIKSRLVNTTLLKFIPNIMENLDKLPEEKMNWMLNCVFMILKDIDFLFDSTKDCIKLAEKIDFNLKGFEEGEFFNKEVFLSIVYGLFTGMHEQTGISSFKIKKNNKHLKKAIKTAEKNKEIVPLKMDKSINKIRVDLAALNIITYILHERILENENEIDATNIAFIGHTMGSVHFPILLKNLKDALGLIDWGEFDKELETSIIESEKDISELETSIMLFETVDYHLQRNSFKNDFMEVNLLDNVMKVMTVSGEMAEIAHNNIQKIKDVINSYLMKNYNINFNFLLQNYTREGLFQDISTINELIKKYYLEHKNKILSYYLDLSKELQKEFRNIIEKKRFIVSEHFSLIIHMFKKSITPNTIRNIFLQLNKDNIESCSKILLGSIENERINMLSNIDTSYWSKVSKISLMDVRKIYRNHQNLLNYDIKIKINLVIDNLPETDTFLKLLNEQKALNNKKDFLFDDEINELDSITLSKNEFLAYIKKENGEYMCNCQKTTENLLGIIKLRQFLGKRIIKHESYDYLRGQLGENLLERIKKTTIKKILNANDEEKEFILYLILNYGIKKTNNLSLTQLDTILDNKSDLETIDPEEIGEYIQKILNDELQEKLEYSKEKLIFGILEICEEKNKNIDLDIDIDYLEQKNEKWLYMCTKILKKATNILKVEVLNQIITLKQQDIINILKIYDILDSFDKDYEFYQFFELKKTLNDFSIKQSSIDELIENAEKLSYNKIISDKNFAYKLSKFLLGKENIDYILSNYQKEDKEIDVLNMNGGNQTKAEATIKQIIDGDLTGIRLKGIFKAQHKIRDCVAQIYQLDFTNLDIKKMVLIKNCYRLKIGDIRILFRREGKNIIFLKIGNRDNFYTDLNEKNSNYHRK